MTSDDTVASSRRDIVGFLSYVRDDDTTDRGRITELRKRLEAEVKMQTGSSYPIFQDRDDIFVGQRWDSRIQRSIDDTSLLIAIITPSYVRSEACRQEIELFRLRERRLNRDDLVIPILYVDTPALNDPEDEVAQDLASRQYFDGRDLRFEELDSNNARRDLARLAGQVVKAIERSRHSDVGSIVPDDVPVDDSPGFLELLAQAEEAFPLLNDTLESLAATQRQVADITTVATEEINAARGSGRPSSATLAATQRFGRRLEVPTSEMESLVVDYLDQLAHVDGGIEVLVEQIPNLSPDEIQEAYRLQESLNSLDDSVAEAFTSLEGYRQALGSAHRLSSSLRPVLGRLSGATRKILDSRPVYSSWNRDIADALTRWSEDQTE
ncbi:MAG: TIR domain-containing protein [Acidimicrobiaceae bacterium]|nr:TIR domain-containing protein [Acidimicrobiaceae bacterium]MYF44520.1 TIR domain-containing protein [Acidimicrobiaceae bacterium]MYJ34708.1 TIR domain-containing protein [Acidimicrobiaceae bacterium]